MASAAFTARGEVSVSRALAAEEAAADVAGWPVFEDDDVGEDTEGFGAICVRECSTAHVSGTQL